MIDVYKRQIVDYIEPDNGYGRIMRRNMKKLSAGSEKTDGAVSAPSVELSRFVSVSSFFD